MAEEATMDLQTQLEKTSGDVNVPQNVLEATILLTKAELLDWNRGDNGTQGTEFGLLFSKDALVLDHYFNPKEDEAGWYMHMTDEQSIALGAVIAETGTVKA